MYCDIGNSKVAWQIKLGEFNLCELNLEVQRFISLVVMRLHQLAN